MPFSLGLRLDESLKDASEIAWVHDPDDKTISVLVKRRLILAREKR